MPDPTRPAAIEASDQDFQKKVVDRSREIPVLVDLWAPWCQPCKILGPLLDKLAMEYQGRFELVKVNMDESPMLAQALQIRGIPAVKLIVNGEIRDQFEGALPEPNLREFLERHLPTDSDNSAISGLKLWLAGQKQQAAMIFQQIAQSDPDNPVVLVGMGLMLVEAGKVDEARVMADQISDLKLDDLPEKQMLLRGLASLRARVFLLENMGSGPASPEDTSLENRFALACQKAINNELEQALELFLGIVRENRQFRSDAGRLGMLAVFDLLPPDSELLGTYRGRLSSLLFA